MNKFQKMLQKINDEKIKIEDERERILNLDKETIQQVKNVKSMQFNTKYGKRIIRLFEKTLEKLFDIKNEFENEYMDFLGNINNFNAKEDNENE